MRRILSRVSRLAVPLALSFAALPALADTRMEKTLRLEPGGEFRLNTDLGKVTVTGTAEAGARVIVTSKHKDLDELLTFRFEEGAGSASVTARRKHRFSFFGGLNDSVQYEIAIPANTRLTIDTSGGGITISGLRGGAHLETSGGGINVRDHVGDVDADTSGGGIRLREVKGKVRANTSGGGVVAEGIEGSIHAESSGGSIELARVTGDIDAETSGGGSGSNRPAAASGRTPPGAASRRRSRRATRRAGRSRPRGAASRWPSTPRRTSRSRRPATRCARTYRSASTARSLGGT